MRELERGVNQTTKHNHRSKSIVMRKRAIATPPKQITIAKKALLKYLNRKTIALIFKPAWHMVEISLFDVFMLDNWR